MHIKPNARVRMNNELFDVNKFFYDKIPLKTIFFILQKHGAVAVQEDGTEWEGILSGREGRVSFDMVDKETNKPLDNCLLVLHWYKHETQYEVTSYIS